MLCSYRGPCYYCLVTKPVFWDPMDCSPHRFLCPWDFPGKNTRVDFHFLLQGIFLTQGSHPHLLHRQVDSLALSHRRLRVTKNKLRLLLPFLMERKQKCVCVCVCVYITKFPEVNKLVNGKARIKNWLPSASFPKTCWICLISFQLEYQCKKFPV